MIDIKDNTPLIEKIMAHFGWYKVKMVEFPIDEVNIQFIQKLTKKDIENAINQEQVAKSSRQEHRSRNQGRQTTKTSSSNSPVRKTSSRKEG